MIIKPFAHGKSRGSSPIDYLLREDYPGRDENPPEVVRGDPELTRELIDNNDRKWKFTSGVCSWSPDDTVDTDQEDEVMDNFEELAFAGLEPNQYNILWVRHSHANHHELHFIIPRLELSTGKAFNSFPPGWEKDFCHLRDYENIKHNWTRPNDPYRARMFTPSNADIIEARLTRWGQNPTKQEKEKARNVINEYLKDQIENGLIKDRSDIITSLREIGLDINRESKNYITVKDPESTEKIRLKGGIYNADWNTTKISREAKREDRDRTPQDREDIQRQLTDIKQELTRVINKRAKYNHRRYPAPDRSSEIKPQLTIQNPEQSLRKETSSRNTSNPSHINRNSTSIMGTTERTDISSTQTNRQSERDRVHDQTTREDLRIPSEGHLRSRPDKRKQGQFHSNPQRLHHRGQLAQRRPQINPPSKELDTTMTQNQLSKSESISLNSNTGDPTNEKERTRDNSNEANHLNRERHRKNKAERRQKNLGVASRILRALRSIDQIDHLTNKIRTSYHNLRKSLQTNNKPLTSKPKSKNQSQGLER